MKSNLSKINPSLFETPNPDTLRHLHKIKPLPIIPNQEKQIELMTDMVNKQAEMINRQSEMIQKQNELIGLIRNEAIESSKQSRLALILSVLGLVSGFIQILPTISSWLEKLWMLLIGLLK